MLTNKLAVQGLDYNIDLKFSYVMQIVHFSFYFSATMAISVSTVHMTN